MDGLGLISTCVWLGTTSLPDPDCARSLAGRLATRCMVPHRAEPRRTRDLHPMLRHGTSGPSRNVPIATAIGHPPLPHTSPTLLPGDDRPICGHHTAPCIRPNLLQTRQYHYMPVAAHHDNVTRTNR